MATASGSGGSRDGDAGAPPKKKPAAKKPAATKPAAKKPAAKKPAAKKRAAKKRKPATASPETYRAAGTFMPADDDPLDTPPAAVASAAASLAMRANSSTPLTPGVAVDSIASVQREPVRSVEDIDRRSRFIKMFELDTDQANDYARAGLVVAGTAALAFAAVVTTSLETAVYAAVIALAIAGGLAAVFMGVRGYKAALRGVASNQRLAVTAVVAGAIVVVATVVAVIVQAFGS